MNYKDYEKFVINYKPFEWEIDHSMKEFKEIRKNTIGY